MIKGIVGSATQTLQSAKDAAFSLFQSKWTTIEGKVMLVMLTVADSHLDDDAYMTSAFESAHALLPLPLRMGIRQSLFVEFCHARKSTLLSKIQEHKALQLSEPQISITIPESVVSIEAPPIPAEFVSNYTPENFEYYKLQILIALAKIDGIVSDEEAVFIEKELENSSLNTEQKLQLTAQLGGTKATTTEGLDVFTNAPEHAIALLSALTALAKQDGSVHVAERMYIKHVGKHLGFSSGDIDEIISSQ